VAGPSQIEPYDEFSMLHENAEEFGIYYDRPPLVRRRSVDLSDGRQLSSLVWGEEEPEYVFLHGGAQNAHTWDTVALALGRPLVAIDLPGHGHSDAGANGSLDTTQNAADVAAVIQELAPHSRCVVGMSLGGMTTLALAASFPQLVTSAVLVDITPGVNSTKSSAISDFVNGPPTFASFGELLSRTIEYNPTRSVASLRRGILHNAIQQPDGTWVWRYARLRRSDSVGADYPDFSLLWAAVSDLTIPLMLVRGMLPQSVVDDEDEVELQRRCPSARIEHIENAGHSVQGDTPVELADLLSNFVNSGTSLKRPTA
jgi:pimeloyl-ACP methyl ester carboxylesterase